MYYFLLGQILAEILGTFILIFSICGIEGSMQLIGNQVALSEYATTAGSAIVVIVFSLGAISGAHVNPAVTIAFAIFGHFSWSKVLILHRFFFPQLLLQFFVGMPQ